MTLAGRWVLNTDQFTTKLNIWDQLLTLEDRLLLSRGDS